MSGNIIGRVDQPFSQLKDVERMSESYLKKLVAEEKGLRAQIEKEVQKQEKLKKKRYESESKIAVTKDKVQDLGILALENRIRDCKTNIERTISAANQIECKTVQRSHELRRAVTKASIQFDRRRLEFKSHETVMNGIKTKKVQADQMFHKGLAADAEVYKLKCRLGRAPDPVNLQHARILLQIAEKEALAAEKAVRTSTENASGKEHERSERSR